MAVLLLTGCKVDAEVALNANSDGSGVVIATVTLDDAAAAEVGPLEKNLRVDDLRQAGWTVVVDDRAVTASKPYDNPDEASVILQEVGGALVSRAEVTRSVTFAKTTTEIDIEVDLTKGLEGFSDPGITEQLGPLPSGFDPKNLDVSLSAVAPGTDRVTAGIPIGERGGVSTAGSDWHVMRLAAATAAPVLALAAVVLFLRRRTVPVSVTDDP